MVGKRTAKIHEVVGIRGNRNRYPHRIAVPLDSATHDYVVGMSKVMGVPKAEFIRQAIEMLRTTPASAFPTSNVPVSGSTTQQGETDGAS